MWNLWHNHRQPQTVVTKEGIQEIRGSSPLFGVCYNSSSSFEFSFRLQTFRCEWTDDGLKQSNYNAEIFKKHTRQEKMEQIKIAQSKGDNYRERYGNSPQHVKCHFKEGQSL